MSTITPTYTPVPTTTPTPTPEPEIVLEEPLEVSAGGFSFQPIKGYDTEIDGAGVGIYDQVGTIIISVYGVTTYSGNQSHEEIIDEFLVEIEERGSGEFQKGKPYPIIIDDIEGTAFDITGTLFDTEIRGQTVLVMPSENQFLCGLAIANLSVEDTKWEEEGEEVFSMLLGSIEFFEAKEHTGSACRVSADDTYGYSKDNPIKVGGDWFDGPARERAYLDSLSGPNGETVSYERIGSIPHGDTILDEYAVTYNGTTVTLYLDEYAFEELLAPTGLVCWTEIPLSAP
jgi:hypothetical protein